MQEFIGQLAELDQELFLYLNSFHNPVFDFLMDWITFKYTWIPMYLALLAFTIRSEKKSSWLMIIAIIAAAGLSDYITSGLMKPYFERLRPCFEPALNALVHNVGGCGGQYGFASSHASTSAAVATTWILLLGHKHRFIWILAIWVVIYSYSRIYVGVHYPGDILVGWIVGFLAGSIIFKIYLIFLRKYPRN
ncbi:phosphatase PAP2 family protein [Dyadobacter tibetensis]|uniref:phosphatase PAP2 family protein n=1 Tax=Dyadobacter tibetensis TaxID=1211851 RepID=UPI0004B87839|nr:phosphatase PAP2 family protein [Dyadobacter tibetensis]